MRLSNPFIQSRTPEEENAFNQGWDTAARIAGNPECKMYTPPTGALRYHYDQGYAECMAFYKNHKGGNTYERH